MTETPSLVARIELCLEHFDLRVDLETTAQVTGVFGPSGCGKTSLLETIAGLRPRARGRVSLGGEVWLDSARGLRQRPERRRIGYVPQDGLLFPHLDVRGNLLAGSARAEARGLPVEETLEAVCELLELGPLLDRGVDSLSGGERQRVSLGRALCSGPQLLLLDEPLASLDLALRRKVLPYLRRVRRQWNLPMLLISHDPTEVQALCDDLLVLRRGEVVARGVPGEVFTDPAVVPLTGPGGYENVVAGTLVEMRGRTSQVRLGEGDMEDSESVFLSTPPVAASDGIEVLVNIPAREILLATHEPRGLSARNLLPATVKSLRPVEGMVLVTSALAGNAPDLTAEITPESAEGLGLTPGLPVYLILKTAGCAVLHAG